VFLEEAICMIRNVLMFINANWLDYMTCLMYIYNHDLTTICSFKVPLSQSSST
jgi:hypothetical protein